MNIEISASNTEDADKQINEAIKRYWNIALKDFSQTKNEEERLEIVTTVMKRGFVPFHIENSVPSVYNAMKESTTIKKIALHKAIEKIDIFHTR